jgi:2-polyprenyl-3-methyl-5-hydroxy-6-metoxy-1,4-benzoquinol methylase
MDNLSKEYVIDYFSRSLEMHGDRPEAVKWTRAGQELHYECLLDIDESIEGSKVLDYGCGKGDFYKFLKERNIGVDYTGCDINRKLISIAAHKFPESTFRVFDIEQDDLNEEYDYILLCGVFNLKVQGVQETTRNTLRKLFHHCRKGMAFNGLSSHNSRKQFELNYIAPEELISFAVRNLSPFYVLRQDRIPYDFTLFVYREQPPEYRTKENSLTSPRVSDT